MLLYLNYEYICFMISSAQLQYTLNFFTLKNILQFVPLICSLHALCACAANCLITVSKKSSKNQVDSRDNSSYFGSDVMIGQFYQILY